jgi:hypothetical protein
MPTEFQKPSIEEVYALIQKELKDIPLDSLDINPLAGINVKPIYNHASQPIHIPFSLDYRVIFQYFRLDKSNIQTTNETILTALSNGQNGLLLDFKNEDWIETEISTLFTSIRIDYLHIEFCETTETTKACIHDYLAAHYPDLNWSHCFFKEHFYYLSYEKFIEEAANCILNFNTEKALIYIELSGDYFWDIAKVRAFKTLLFNHRKLDGKPANIIIIGETSTKKKSTEKQENNLLKLTTEAMSAMIGGCEGIWIRPFNEDHAQDFSTRISRNIFHLMQEESYMHLVRDVSAGSYFIENYTEQIARLIYSELTKLKT